MKIKDRQSLFQALADLSLLYPPMRLGQLCDMVASMAGPEFPAQIDEVEDAAAAKAACDHARERAQQLEVERTTSLLTSIRVEILQTLQNLGEQHPQLRWGQLVTMIAKKAGGNLYDLEDDQMLEAAQKCLGKTISV